MDSLVLWPERSADLTRMGKFIIQKYKLLQQERGYETLKL